MEPGDAATVGKLVLSAANRILREVLIDRERLTIGRRPYNDLLLDDLTVSGEHAVVHTQDGGSVIHDLKSRNGTLINGAPVTRRQLADGDCVDIGIYRLVYRIEQVQAGRPLSPFRPFFMPPTQSLVPTNLFGARTSAWLPSAAANPPGSASPPGSFPAADPGQPVRPAGSDDPDNPRRPANPALAASLPPEDSRPASLRFLGGHEVGRQVRLERPIVSIRNDGGQVAVVARRLKGYFLTHLEGPAYPLVNGESIGLGAHALSDNDLIELAGTIIQFSIEP